MSEVALAKTTEASLARRDDELTVQQLIDQVGKIQQVMSAVMHQGEHYGTIPGTPKPTLLKPGAEKLCLLFRLDPEYETTEKREGEHMHVVARCTLYHAPSGQRRGSGMGSCSTREKKYDKSRPADIYNTVLKMACKRALVAAVLNVTAASDIFTQDLEDLKENGAPMGKPRQQRRAPAQAAAPGDPVIAFGKNKGKRISQLSERQREWYRQHFSDKLREDPGSRYADEWRTMLAALGGEEPKPDPDEMGDAYEEDSYEAEGEVVHGEFE